jgi:hypothetical protein
MNPHLEHLARRLTNDPLFLAAILADYAGSEQLDDNGLAARLGCPVPVLTNLRLCRTPRPEAPLFWQDVEQIAARFAVDAKVLAEMVRRGESLHHLRRAAGGAAAAGTGFLLAARDGAPPGEEPP